MEVHWVIQRGIEILLKKALNNPYHSITSLDFLISSTVIGLGIWGLSLNHLFT